MPRILANPAGSTVWPGASLVLRVVAAGPDTLEYLWFHDGVPMEDADRPVLDLSPVTVERGGVYTVSIRNHAGRVVSAPAVVQVHEPPRLERQSASRTLAAGESVTFAVKAGGTGPLRYQWRKDGRPLAGATTSSLRIQNLRESDAGRYSVVVANALGAVTSDGALLNVASASVGDTDKDGMPDDWERAHGLNPASAGDADSDPDGDGLTNLQEYLAGTDPRSAASSLRVTGLEISPAGDGWRVLWNSIPGRTYALQRWNSRDLTVDQAADWVEVGSMAAASTTSALIDAGLQSHALYRLRVVVGAPPVVTNGPALTDLQFAPSPLTTEGWATLSVLATGPAGVAGVTFYDGATVLGSATRLETGRWRVLWPVAYAMNGVHALSAVALDNAGKRGTSAPVNCTVAIPAPLASLSSGRLVLRSDAFRTNGTTVTPGTTVQFGGATLSGMRSFGLVLDTGRATGSGRVTVPGLGVVHDGNFALDTWSGWLTAQRAASQASVGSTPFAPIALNSRCLLTPTVLQVQVVTNTMVGAGTVELTIPGFASGPARFEGVFRYEPESFALTVRGAVTLGAKWGTNLVATIRLGDSTFSVYGDLSLPGGSGGGALALANARVELGFDASGAPGLRVQGTRRDNGLAAEGTLLADGSVRVTATPVTPAFVTQHPDLFVPLGPDGNPIEGGVVQARSDGSLPPLEYRPAGRSLLGGRGSMGLRLPGGARFVAGAAPALEFVQARAVFGPDSPLQFSVPLERLGGATLSLAIGPLDVRTLAGLFDLPAELPMKLFRSVPLLWRGGVLTDGGIAGAVVAVADDFLPLPRSAAGDAYPAFRLDLAGGGGLEVKLPLFGELKLDDASGSPLSIGVPAANPAWLTLRADGRVALQGRGHAKFPNGVSLDVDLMLDDPKYRLGFAASGFHFALLDGLAGFLPQAACPLPAAQPAPGESAITNAIPCREKLALAYATFSAAMTDATTSSGLASAMTTVPGPRVVMASAADAWAALALSSAGAVPGAGQVADLLRQTRRSAVAARDLNGVLRQRVTLERALRALRDKQALGADQSAEFGQLSDEVAAAAVLRANDAASQFEGRAGDLAIFRETLALLVEAETLAQLVGQGPAGGIQRPDLGLAMRSLATAFSTRYADAQGVVRTVARAPAGSRVAEMPRAVAYQGLADVAGILADAQRLGLDDALDPRLGNELTRQLADQLQKTCASALLEAEAGRDFLGFATIALDALHLDSIAALYASDTELVSRVTAIKSNLAARLGALKDSDPAFGVTPSIEALVARLDRLSRFLGEVPSSVSLLTPAMGATLERMDEALAGAVSRLGEIRSSVDGVGQLAVLLRAGTKAAAAREQLGMGVGGAWEDAGLGSVASKLAEVAIQQKAWTELHEASGLMLGQAARLASRSGSRARLHLEKADAFLDAAHTVAVAVWNEEKQRRGGLSLVDMMLPGEIVVSKVAGSAEYDRRTRELSGTFSGELGLPKFSGQLSVLNASIATGGELDLSAAGEIALPSAENPRLTLGVLPRHPLHVYARRNGQVGVSGSCRVAANGMFFEGFLILEDPIYGFGIATGGQRLELPEKILGYIPVFDSARLSALPAAARGVGAEYLEALGNSLEPLSKLTAPQFAPVGTPPDYSESEFDVTTAPISMAAGAVTLMVAGPVVLAGQALETAVTNLVVEVGKEWGRFQRDLERAEQDLRGATAAGKSQARRALARSLGDAAKALSRVAKASQAVTLAQQGGRVPTGPQYVPGQDLGPAPCAAIKAKLELLAADPELAYDAADLRSVLGSMETYRAMAADAGCPGLEFPASQGTDFVKRARVTLLAPYGLGEDGQVSNPEVFLALPDGKLEEAARTALQIDAAEQLGNGSADLSTRSRQAMITLFARRQELGSAEVRRIRSTKFALGSRDDCDALRQEKLLEAHGRMAALYRQFQLAGIDDAPLRASADGGTNAVNATADYITVLASASGCMGKLAGYATPGDPRFDLDYKKLLDRRQFEELMQRSQVQSVDGLLQQALKAPLLERPWRVPVAVMTELEQAANLHARRLHDRALGWAANAEAVQFTLGQAVELARHLMALSRVLEMSGRVPGSVAEGPALLSAAPNINEDFIRQIGTRILPVYTNRVTALAKAQKAWWVLTRAARVLAEGVGDSVTTNLNLTAGMAWTQAVSTWVAADGLIREIYDTVKNEPVTLQLPGDLVVDRVFGEIQLNRATQRVIGSFGGKLRFPNSDLYVEIAHATVSNDGKFSFGGELGAPIPVGSIRMKAHVDVAGQARVVNGKLQGSLNSFVGTGTLYLPPFDGSQPVEVEASLSYANDHTLTLATTADNLHLNLSRDFQLFNAGGSLTFRDPATSGIPLPTSGELVLQGSAGLFARVADPQTASDYYITGESLTLRFRSRHDAASNRDFLDVTFLDGLLTLPEMFSAGLCSADGGSGGNSGQSAQILIDPANPLGVSFRLKPPTAGQPPQLESMTINAATLDLHNIGLRVPNMSGFGAEICDGELKLPALTVTGTSAPLPAPPTVIIRRGTMKVPLPPGQSTSLDLVDFTWKLDGFPAGTLELANTIRLVDLGHFTFEALGRDGSSHAPCRITVGTATGNRPPPLEITGDVRFWVSPDVLKKEPSATDPGTQVAITASGSISFEAGKVPDLSRLFESVGIEGSFTLGGGLGLQGFPARAGRPAELAKVTLTNLRNLPAVVEGRQLPSEEAFTVTMSGMIKVPEGPAFGGRNLRFIFHNRSEGRPPNAPKGVPQFLPGSFDYDASGWELAEALPFQVSAATLGLVDPNASYPWPQLLRPDHWQLTITASLSLPSPSKPVLSGKVYDWTVTFASDGAPQMNLNAIQLGVENVTFPPIDNIGGTVHVGGLSSRPPKPFFVGRVGGFIYGYGVDLLFGFNQAGPIGACVRGTLGNVGIPLGTSGFIINGASGGVSFANSSQDPCLIAGYLNEDGSLKSSNELPSPDLPPPPMSWDAVGRFADEFQHRVSLFGSGAAPASATVRGMSPAQLLASEPPGALALLSNLDDDSTPAVGLNARGLQFASLASTGGTGTPGPKPSKWGTPCPDDCPPATVNIFCEPHPDREAYPDRVIAKFSSLDEDELKAIGLNENAVGALWDQAGHDVSQLAALVAAKCRAAANDMVPRPIAGLPKSAEINAYIDGTLDGLENALAGLVHDQLTPLVREGLTEERLWSEIKTVAYRGAPCPDITVKLSGQLGHYTGAVSGDAGVVLSTAGTAGIVSDVNLLGVPVGQLKGFVAVTDKSGNYNPSLCGQLDVHVGPVNVGKAAASFINMMSQDAARVFFNSLGTCIDARIIGPLAQQVRADVVTAGKSSSQILAQLSTTQQLALAALLQKQPGLDGVIPCLRTAMADGWSQYDPELLACGEGQPRVLGVPTGPRLAEFGVLGNKQRFFAAADASASGTIAYAATMAACTAAGAAIGAVVTVEIFGYGAIAGAIAGGSLGLTVGAVAGGVSATLFSFERGMVSLNSEIPDPMEPIIAAMSGKLSSPEKIVKYGEDGVDLMLQKASVGGSWSLVPLGFRVGSANGRILMPEWNNHPNRPGVTWVQPGTGSRADWPTPAELLLAMTRERVMRDASWQGNTRELGEILPAGAKHDAVVNGLGVLSKDFFPYGGFFYGMDLLVPRALVAAPPQELRTAADAGADPLQRFLGAMTFFQDYVMTTTNVGALASYVPFPGPLIFDAPDGSRLAPHALVKQIENFDPATWIRMIDAEGVEAAKKLYPGHLFFAEGYIDGTLLGVPIANGVLKLVPPNLKPPTAPSFTVDAEVPTGSWLRDWVDRANLHFELTQAPPMSIEEWSTNVVRPLLERSRYLANPGLTDAVSNQKRVEFAQMLADAVATNLPKAYLEATVSNLHIPSALTALLQASDSPSASARLYAYSPRFAPQETNNSPRGDAMRMGGVVLSGDFTFGRLVTVTNAEIAFLPNPGMLADPRSPPSIHARVQDVTVGGAATGLNFANASLDLVADLNYPALPGSLPPKLSFTGRLASIRLPADAAAPLLEIRALDGQPDLGVTLDLSLSGQKTFRLSPGQLTVNGPLGGTKFRIHGATASDPFTYSATEPWTNNLTLAAGAMPALYLDGQRLAQLQAADLTGAVLQRDAAGLITLRARLKSGAKVSFLPDSSALATTLTLNAEGSLEMGSDGSFVLNGSTGNAWKLAGADLPTGAFALRVDASTHTATLAMTTASSVPLGLFLIEPLVTGAPLDVQLSLRYLASPGPAGLGRWDAGLSLPPARLRLPRPDDSPAPLISSTTAFQVDGGLDPATRQPRRFTLSSDANVETTNRISFAGRLDLWAKNTYFGTSGSTEIVRYEIPALEGTLTARGQSSAHLHVALSESGMMTTAPAWDISRRTFRMGPGEVDIDSAGAFRVWGRLATSIASGDFFKPFDFQFGATSEIEVTQSHLRVGLSATTIDNFGMPGLRLSGAAEYTFTLPYLTQSLNGTLRMDPVRMPYVEWLPASDSDAGISGSVGYTGTAAAGAGWVHINDTKVRIGGAGNPTVGIGGFDLKNDGTLSAGFQLDRITLPVPGSSSGFTLGPLALSLRRDAGGQVYVAVDSAKLSLPGWADLNVSGSLQGTGPQLIATASTSLFNFAGADLGVNLAFGPEAYAGLVLGDAPEAYWRLDDNSQRLPSAGTVMRVADQMGRHGAVVTNATKASTADVLQNRAGAIPGEPAYTFGGGSFVFVTNSPSLVVNQALNLPNRLSLEAWVWCAGFDRDWQTVISKGSRGWQIHRYANSRRVSFGTVTPGGTADELASSVDVDDGQWHHLVATYDGTTKKLYIDGRLNNYSAGTTGALAVNTLPVAIGGCPDVAGRTFRGGIDEVAVYARALTDLEVIEHYAAARGFAAGRLALKIPGFGNQTTVQMSGTLATNGMASFGAGGQVQSLIPGLALANSAVEFYHDANAAQALLRVSGDLDSPSLRALLHASGPLRFSGFTTGNALSLVWNVPVLNFGPSTAPAFVVSSAEVRLDSGGLRLSGAHLDAYGTVAGLRAKYLSLGLPALALPSVVPSAGLVTALSLEPFPILAPGLAGGSSLATHLLHNASMTMTWKPDALSFAGISMTYDAIPGFANWARVVFKDGVIDTAGRFSMAAPSLPPLELGIFQLQGVTPRFTESGLHLTGAALQAGNFFRSANLPDLVVPADTQGMFDWHLPALPSMSLGGVPFSRIPTITLHRARPSLSGAVAEPAGDGVDGPHLESFGGLPVVQPLATSLIITDAELGIPGVPTAGMAPFKFSGSIDSAGRIQLLQKVPEPLRFLGFDMVFTNRVDSAPGRYRAGVMADAPEAYWRLGDAYHLVSTAGSIPNAYEVLDETGRHTTTISRAALSGNLILQGEPGVLAGDTNTAFRFRGSGVADQFIALPVAQEAAFDFPAGFTLETWVKLGPTTRGYDPLISKGTAWQLSRVHATGKVQFWTRSAASGQVDVLLSSADLADGGWHHLTATYDGNTKSLYVDGRLDKVSVVGVIETNNDYVRLGGTPSSEGPPPILDGWLDEVAVYPRALSLPQVVAHYQTAGGGALLSRMNLMFDGRPFATLDGSIATNGSVRARASLPSQALAGFQFGPVALDLQRVGANGVPNLGVTAVLPQWVGSTGNLFDARPSLGGTLSMNGTTAWASLSVTGQVSRLLGFPIGNALELHLDGPVVPTPGSVPRMMLKGAVLRNFALLPASVSLAGSLSPLGDLSMSADLGNQRVGGFSTDSLSVTLDSREGLSAAGDFKIVAWAADRDVSFVDGGAAVRFSGTFGPDGAVAGGALLGSFALKLGAFTADPGTFRLQADGLWLGSGTHELNFGELKVPFGIFSLKPGGVSEFYGWRKVEGGCPDCPFSPEWNASVGLSFDGATGEVSGSLGGSITVKGVRNPTGKGDSSSQSMDLAGSIGWDGDLSLDLPAPFYTLYWGTCTTWPTGKEFPCLKVSRHDSISVGLW